MALVKNGILRDAKNEGTATATLVNLMNHVGIGHGCARLSTIIHHPNEHDGLSEYVRLNTPIVAIDEV